MSNIFHQIVANGDTVLAWLGALLVGLLSKYVIGKIKSGAVHDIMQRALIEVDTAVSYVWQTYAKSLKAANEDGKLTAAEKETAKDLALAAAKSYIGTKGIKSLARILGLDSVDSWLGGKIESSVVRLKAADTEKK